MGAPMDRTRIDEGVRRMRFESLLDRHERGEITQAEAAEMLGVAERTFRRWRDRYEEEGEAGLADRRLGRPSPRRAPAAELERMLGLYRDKYADFTVKHFHEQLVTRHGYTLGYTVTKVHLHRAGLVRPARQRSAHRKKRPRRPLVGIEHIAAYSPEARGRSERLFRTLQDRLPKELRLAGLTTIAAANVWLRETYMAAHNAAFAIAPAAEGTAFVADAPGAWREILCIEDERVVGNDNTLAWNGRRLQLPASRLRPHFVKATVRVHAYPDGTVSVFLGPHRLASYTAEGQEITSAPTAPSVPG